MKVPHEWRGTFGLKFALQTFLSNVLFHFGEKAR